MHDALKLKPLDSRGLIDLNRDLRNKGCAFDIVRWCREARVFLDEVEPCIKHGELSAYGQARLRGTIFRHMEDADAVTLDTFLKMSSEPDLEQWAIAQRIFLHQILRCVDDGMLNNWGRMRMEFVVNPPSDLTVPLLSG